MNCPFCKIITENSERIIRQTERVFVVLSNPKLMRGHLLVIPKRHVEKLSELDKEERVELFEEIINIENKIIEKIASGCDITQHYRPFIQQNNLKVDHVHFHLKPREFEDELYKKVQIHEKELFSELTKEELKSLEKIFN
jgi:histidine triad (HIT) family protein